MSDDVSLLEHATAALAFELAAKLVPAAQVLSRFSISEEQYRALLASEQFRKLLKEAKDKWDSPMSVAERTRLKAQFSIEQCLLPLHGIVHDGKSATQSRIDAAKLIAAIAGLNRGEATSPQEARFSLNINLGPDHRVSLERLIPKQIDDAGVDVSEGED